MTVLKRLRPVRAVLFLLIAIAGPVHAGNMSPVAHFARKAVTADINTFSDNGTVVALLVFKTKGYMLTFAFDRNDWSEMQSAWKSAVREKGNNYVSEGSFVEPNTTEKSVLLIASGPTVRLTIASPINGVIVFDIPRSMVADFDAKLRQAASAATGS
jgi:hypothetical protein